MSRDQLHEALARYPGILKLHDVSIKRRVLEFDFTWQVHAADFGADESGDLGDHFEYRLELTDAPYAKIHIRITDEGFVTLADNVDHFSESEMRVIDDACAQEAESYALTH